MGVFEWGAITAVIAIGGIIWRLSWRLATQEGRIVAAATTASGAATKAVALERDLAAHREHVAAEYLSKDAMKDITVAINRLGDRLDTLFLHFTPKP